MDLPTRIRLVGAAFVFVTGTAGAQLVPSPVPASQEFRVVYSRVITPPIFASDAPTHSNIFTVDTGLPIETQITDDNNSFSPVPSPDGSKIVFVRLDPGTCEGCIIPARYDLAIMHVDGSEVRVLQPLSSRHLSVKWSPDGKSFILNSIVLAAGPNGEPSSEYHLFLISAEVPAPRIDLGPAQLFGETWSPNGKWIAFGCAAHPPREYNSSRLCLVSPDAPKDVTVIDEMWGGDSPAWSPDGSALVYFRKEQRDHILVLTRISEKKAQSLASFRQSAGVPV